ncbi:MAG: hypothetical protein IJZ46_02795 [Bacilli bacterium]|nr:hypothetical protein [Bacilli bacterium]
MKKEFLNKLKKTIKNNPSVTFKWVHVYDFDSKGFNRYLLPIRNDNYIIIVNENEYNILDIYPNNTDLYSNKKYHEDFNNKFHNYESTNGFIYIEKTYVIPERNNFELLSAVYETMINGESINNKIDRAIENSKYKMKIKSLI